MKFMTWNIRLGIQEGLEPIAEALCAQDADIVALQEVGRRWVMGPRGDTTARLAQLAGYDHHFFVPSLSWFPPAQYGHAILSKYPLEQPRIVRLPRSSDEPRTALFTTIHEGATSFDLATTHLSHVGDRPLQGDALVDLLMESEQFVLMGDLNESALKTAWMRRLSGIATPAPAEDPTFPASAPEHRIDWIWSSFGEWKSATVVDTGDRSDHLAVVAELGSR